MSIGPWNKSAPAQPVIPPSYQLNVPLCVYVDKLTFIVESQGSMEPVEDLLGVRHHAGCVVNRSFVIAGEVSEKELKHWYELVRYSAVAAAFGRVSHPDVCRGCGQPVRPTPNEIISAVRYR